MLQLTERGQHVYMVEVQVIICQTGAPYAVGRTSAGAVDETYTDMTTLQVKDC